MGRRGSGSFPCLSSTACATPHGSPAHGSARPPSPASDCTREPNYRQAMHEGKRLPHAGAQLPLGDARGEALTAAALSPLHVEIVRICVFFCRWRVRRLLETVLRRCQNGERRQAVNILLVLSAHPSRSSRSRSCRAAAPPWRQGATCYTCPPFPLLNLNFGTSFVPCFFNKIPCQRN
jgi:hypothetical protein